MKRLTETMVLLRVGGLLAPARRSRSGGGRPSHVAHGRRQAARGRASSGRHFGHAVAHRRRPASWWCRGRCRRRCAAGGGRAARPGSEICSSAIAAIVPVRLDGDGRCRAAKRSTNMSGSRLARRPSQSPPAVDQRRLSWVSARCAVGRRRSSLQRLGGLDRGRLVERLAPLHLLDQELRRHRGVVLRLDGRAVQLAQVGRALERVLQALVGLVDARGPLHRHACAAAPSEAKRSGCTSACSALARVERGAVLLEAAGDAEQHEVVAVEFHGGTVPGKEACGREKARLTAAPRRSEPGRSDSEGLAAAATRPSRSGC